MGGRIQERSPEGQDNEWKYAAEVVGAGGGGNLLKVPETWDARGFQDLMGMTFATMPNSGEIEPEDTTSNR